MEGHCGQAIFCGVFVMLAALASGCGGLSARQSVSPSSMLFLCFGSVVVGVSVFSLVEDRCGCSRSIFRVENGTPASGCYPSSLLL